MPGHFEYIDAFFNQTLSDTEAKRFEQMLVEDKEFAGEVAFYLSAKQALKEHLEKEKKEWFKQLLTNNNSVSVAKEQGEVRKMWFYRAGAVAAFILLGFFSWYLFFPQSIPVQTRAESYIKEHLKTLPVTMGTNPDSIQLGLKLYNEGHLEAARDIFESVIQNDTNNYSGKKYLGIVYLRLANYDKALLYFQLLESYSLYSNPANFYQALTLMKRNLPGDKATAKQLLQQVVDKNLEGKSAAQQFLKNW